MSTPDHENPSDEILLQEGGYGLHAALVREAARARGWDVIQHTSELYTIRSPERAVSWWNTIPDTMSTVQKRILRHKNLTRDWLRGVVPETMLPRVHLGSGRHQSAYIDMCSRGRYVLKPVDGSGGWGVVYLNARTTDQDIRRAMNEHPGNFVVEEEAIGRNYRVLVVGGTIAGVVERTRPVLRGSGTLTMRELYREVVQLRDRNPYLRTVPLPRYDSYLRMVVRDELDRLPINVSQGAFTHTVHYVHTGWNALASAIARVFDRVPVLGIDVVSPDISTTLGSILEVNAVPDLGMHHFPQYGPSVPVAEHVLSTVFAT